MQRIAFGKRFVSCKGLQAPLQQPRSRRGHQRCRSSVLRGDIRKWSSLCTSLSKIFSRGVNRNFLNRAYRDHKIARSPRSMAPTKVRVIVHCGKLLDQSLRHHGARVQAVRLAIGKLIKAKGQHIKEEEEQGGTEPLFVAQPFSFC